ncbi:MAG: hypothetical protein V3V08_12790 [Nannocystaceae bacterium]
MQAKEVRSLSYTFDTEIGAGRPEVWQALTGETDRWWLPDFRMLGQGSVVEFQPHAGGQIIGRMQGGGSLLWYTVQMCRPGQSIHLVGHIAPEWGGPTVSMLKWELIERGDQGTLVRTTDALLGPVGDGGAESAKEGWTQLIGRGLKPYVE